MKSAVNSQASTRLFSINEPKVVFAFLDLHQDLKDLLFDAHGKIGILFPLAICKLEINENLYDTPMLVLSIITDLNSKIAFEHLQKFNAEWMFPYSQIVKYLLVVNVAFR